jgi:hypothetical protein
LTTGRNRAHVAAAADYSLGNQVSARLLAGVLHDSQANFQVYKEQGIMLLDLPQMYSGAWNGVLVSFSSKISSIHTKFMYLSTYTKTYGGTH